MTTKITLEGKASRKNITFKGNPMINQIFADANTVGQRTKSGVIKNALEYYHTRIILPMKATIQGGE